LTSLRQAWRSLSRTPLVTTAVIACLSSSIAAATAMFSVVDGVVVRALPFRHASQLVAIWGVNPARDTVHRGFSWPDVRDLARDSRALDGVGAMENAGGGMTLTGTGDPVRIPTRTVSGNFFDLLGVRPLLGRTLRPDDETTDARVAVVSYGLWVRRFGGAPDVVGRTVSLNGATFLYQEILTKRYGFLMLERLSGFKKNATRLQAPALSEAFSPRGARSDATPHSVVDCNGTLPTGTRHRPKPSTMSVLR